MVTESTLNTGKTYSAPVSGSIRFLNFLIDMTFWFSILWILNLYFDLDYLSQSELYNFSVLSATFGIYYLVMEVSFQKTVGKFITRTKVIDLDGGTPSVAKFILRTFCRFLPLDQFSFLFVRRGFHDYLSGTVVVNE